MSSHLDKMNEECGVVGVYRPDRAASELVHRGLFALQHRGQEAAGIASWGEADDTIHHLRGVGLVADCLPIYKVKDLPGPLAMGHVRYSTVPADRQENIQPFVATTPYGRLSIAHNGNIKNAAELQQELEAQGSIISTTMDTELIVHLIARSGAEDFRGALKSMASKVKGAYSLVFLCAGKLYALRDPHGVRPLVIGKSPRGNLVVASETCALEALEAEFLREVEPGEFLEIGPDGFVAEQLLEPAPERAPCVFELVYFARPDSTVFGQGVHKSRTAMGETLAREDFADPSVVKPDIVVPIPDSGIPGAIGYARESGIPLEKAIIRSHYVGRTFILPDQDSRTHSLRLKLSVISESVKGKRVVLVDDSIVRGNTSRMIVQMVRDAGAKEVWMRILSPPLGWPCYLGIDTPTREELVINQQGTPEKVGEFIGADSMRYLSIPGLRDSTGRGSYCFACMDGKYPV